MGNVIDSNHIELFLKANGIFNISVSDHLVKNNDQIQNVLHTTIFIHNTNTLHTKIVNIIGQNNYYENYILHKNSIINKIMSADTNLKKQKLKKVNSYKKKINDALNSKQLGHLVEFEIK